MHRIFGSQLMEKGIGIGEDLGIKQMIQAQRAARLAGGNGRLSVRRHSRSLSVVAVPFARSYASSSLIACSLSRMSISMCSDSFEIVGRSKRLRRLSSTPNV